jgi:hypothetical protein
MRHADIKLTMGVYTDPKLLDVRGGLDALPILSLVADLCSMEFVSETGTGGTGRTVAPTVAPILDSSGQSWTKAILRPAEGSQNSFDVSGSPDMKKGRLSSADNRPKYRGERIRTSDLLNPI